MAKRFSLSRLVAPATLARGGMALRSAVLVAVTLLVVALLPHTVQNLALVSSMGSTAIVALLFPHGPFATVRSVVGGHVVASSTGFAAVALAGPSAATAAIAVGVAVALMLVTRTMQPPAGGDPIIVAGAAAGTFMEVGVSILAGACIIAGAAELERRFRHRLPGAEPE